MKHFRLEVVRKKEEAFFKEGYNVVATEVVDDVVIKLPATLVWSWCTSK